MHTNTSYMTHEITRQLVSDCSLLTDNSEHISLFIDKMHNEIQKNLFLYVQHST